MLPFEISNKIETELIQPTENRWLFLFPIIGASGRLRTTKFLLFCLSLSLLCTPAFGQDNTVEENPFKTVAADDEKEASDTNAEQKVQEPESPFEVETKPEELARIQKFNLKQNLSAITVSPDGNTVAFSMSRGSKLYLMDTRSGVATEAHKELHSVFSPSLLRFSPSGSQLLSACFNGEIKVVRLSDDLKKASDERTFKVSGQIRSLAFAKNKPNVLVCDRGSNAVVFDYTASGKVAEAKLTDFQISRFLDCHLTNESGQALIADRKQIVLVDFDKAKAIQRIAKPDSISGCSFSPKGRELVYTLGSRKLEIQNVVTGDVRKHDPGNFKQAKFITDSLIAVLGEYSLDILRADNFKLVHSFATLGYREHDLEHMEVCDNGTRLIVLGNPKFSSSFYIVDLSEVVSAKAKQGVPQTQEPTDSESNAPDG